MALNLFEILEQFIIDKFFMKLTMGDLGFSREGERIFKKFSILYFTFF